MEQTGMAGEAKFINGAFSAVATHLLLVDLSWLWLLHHHHHHHHHPHPPPPLLSPTFHSTWPRWYYATLPNLINVAFDHLGALVAPVMVPLLRRATRHHVAFKSLVRVVWFFMYFLYLPITPLLHLKYFVWRNLIWTQLFSIMEAKHDKKEDFYRMKLLTWCSLDWEKFRRWFICLARWATNVITMRFFYQMVNHDLKPHCIWVYVCSAVQVILICSRKYSL